MRIYSYYTQNIIEELNGKSELFLLRTINIRKIHIELDLCNHATSGLHPPTSNSKSATERGGGGWLVGIFNFHTPL